MIKKIFFLLVFNNFYNNNVNSFRLNDNFLIYIIDNDLKNITSNSYIRFNTYKPQQKYNLITNNIYNIYNYLIKLILIPSKKNKNKNLKRITNSTKKKRRDDCEEKWYIRHYSVYSKSTNPLFKNTHTFHSNLQHLAKRFV